VTLSPAATEAVNASLAELRAATLRAEAAAASASGGINAWWAGVLGADSSVSALHTNAKAARTLLEALTGKAARLDTDDEARELVRTVAAFTDTSHIEAAAAFLTPGAAAAEVAAGTARDLGAVASGIGGSWLAILKASPFLVVAFLLVVGWSWLGRRHE